jgi:O-methyltransferase involved in polyketide biosynthesis
MRAVAPGLIARRALLAARSRFGEHELDAAILRGATQHVIVGAGFLTDEVSFFSWFGGSPYPSAQATLAALAFIGSLPSGSSLAFDYTVRRPMDRTLMDRTLDWAEETAMDALASRFAPDGEPLQLFVDSRALGTLLSSAGFHQVEDLGPAEIDRRYFNPRADGLRAPPGLVHLVSARV